MFPTSESKVQKLNGKVRKKGISAILRIRWPFVYGRTSVSPSILAGTQTSSVTASFVNPGPILALRWKFWSFRPNIDISGPFGAVADRKGAVFEFSFDK